MYVEKYLNISCKFVETKKNIMKKLLFVIAFVFVGSQAFSQIYIMTITEDDNINQCSSSYERTISKITPAGVETHICFDSRISTKLFAGLGLMIKLFKVVATSSRPLALQGMAKINVVPLLTSPYNCSPPPPPLPPRQ